jgi:adenosylcobinamide-phosphate guanylyltransferase
MDAIIMAGGMGRRLGKDEKPLTLLCGKPLIHYVLDALLGAKNIDRVYVATSPRVEKTISWLSDFVKMHDRVDMILTPGKGFVKDMILAVEMAGIRGRVFMIMADLPLITPQLIDRITETYGQVNSAALSVHMKLDVFTRLDLRPDTVFHKNGDFIVPCGINILNAEKIHEEQQDYNFILEDEMLALNVNKKEDLEACQRYLKALKIN